MLKIVDLRKTYHLDMGAVEALRGVSFEISEGEFFTLLGPSGSGKSTALRCVAGLEHPDSGEITIAGECVYSSAKGIQVPPDQRPIGMVFQSYAIWPHMTVFGNVAFPLTYGSRGQRPSKREVRELVGDALRQVQMEDYGDRPATQLSGGQQQRVALARALVCRPKLLLLDEPLSNLDAKLREEMRVELKDLTRSLGITSFFVTHDQLEALALSDQIAVIMQGKLVESGAPQDVYVRTADRRVASFLGVANTVEGRVVSVGDLSRVETAFGALALRQSGAGIGAAAVVAIRPEAMICSRDRFEVGENLFEGTVERATFLGTYIDGEVSINGYTLRVNFTPYDRFARGDRVFVHIPVERCHLIA